MVLIITGFEWTWLSYIIDIFFAYWNTYTYMSCTCNKGESTVCCFILFINSCEKNMLKTMHVSNSWIFLNLFAAQKSFISASLSYLCYWHTLCCRWVHCFFNFYLIFNFFVSFFFFILHKNLHNCFGHLDIPRTLAISL